MNRNEQLISVLVISLLLLAQGVIMLVPAPVPTAKVPSSGGQVAALATAVLPTNTPAPSATIPPTATPLASQELGISQGAVRAGYTAAYTSGVALLHGLGGAPKACLPLFISGTAITVTAIVSSSTAFTLTTGAANIPMYWVCSR